MTQPFQEGNTVRDKHTGRAGTVMDAWHDERGMYVAVKFIGNKTVYSDLGGDEPAISRLELVGDEGPEGLRQLLSF